MATTISAKDHKALNELAHKAGSNVSFEYVDAQGKHTKVDSKVDASTVKDGSILTFDERNGYHRYSFSRIASSEVKAD